MKIKFYKEKKCCKLLKKVYNITNQQHIVCKSENYK